MCDSFDMDVSLGEQFPLLEQHLQTTYPQIRRETAPFAGAGAGDGRQIVEKSLGFAQAGFDMAKSLCQGADGRDAFASVRDNRRLGGSNSRHRLRRHGRILQPLERMIQQHEHRSHVVR